MSLYVYTPSLDGQISGDTHDSIIRLVTSGARIKAIFDKTNHDLVRARSRAVARFLSTDFSHLLFVDSDVGFDPKCVQGMMLQHVDVISTPYPKKRLMLSKYKEAIQADFSHPSAALHEWGFRRKPGNLEAEGEKAEVLDVPMGLTLISRECLETMTEHFRSTLGFQDMPDMGDSGGRVTDCVALFQLMIKPSPDGKGWLMPEDFSFCERWRAIGGRVHIYIGDGSPATHWGAYRFSSDVED